MNEQRYVVEISTIKYTLTQRVRRSLRSFYAFLKIGLNSAKIILTTKEATDSKLVEVTPDDPRYEKAPYMAVTYTSDSVCYRDIKDFDA